MACSRRKTVVRHRSRAGTGTGPFFGELAHFANQTLAENTDLSPSLPARERLPVVQTPGPLGCPLAESRSRPFGGVFRLPMTVVSFVAVLLLTAFPESVQRGAAAPPDATSPSSASWRVLKRTKGPCGWLEVVEGPQGRAILCEGTVQTLIPSAGLGPAAGMLIRGRDYTGLLPYFRPQTRRALLIGVGGGLHAQALAVYGIKTQGVDVDPAMIALAREYLGLTIDVEIVDGREFLARTPSRYDAIVLDAFAGDAPVKHLHTPAAFSLMADHMEPEGVLVVHAIGPPQDATMQVLARALEGVFSHVVAARSGLADERQHVYLFASRRPLELLPEHRRTLESYGFTGNELYTIGTRQTPPVADNQPPTR
jgi:hypothetical protein